MRTPPAGSMTPTVTVKFSVDTTRDVVQAKVVDTQTKEIVREIPSDEQVQVRETVEHIVDKVT